MTIFEPLFLLLALVTLLSLVGAGIAVLRGRFAAARATLRRIGLGAAIYFGLAILVSLVRPAREYHVGDERCFDDWCFTVTEVQRAPEGPRERVEVTLRLSSRARGAPQRERGTVVYLVDAAGRRFDPLPAPDQPPLDVLLQPGESVLTKRRFELPAGAEKIGLVYTLEGGFPIGWFLIGGDGWFAAKPVVRFPDPREGAAR